MADIAADYVKPQYFTPRRPERPTLGAQCAETAAMMRLELQPWQQAFLDVAGELVEDDDGVLVPAYDTVQLSVGRRAGKTVALLVLMLTKMRTLRRARCHWTAQDQSSAAVSLRYELVPLLEDAGLEFNHIKANGREGLELGESMLKLFTPKPHALHGQASDGVLIDECFRFTREQAADLMVAIRPLMATRPQGQLLLGSAAGNADGTFWIDTLETGRILAGLDRGEGTCHWEYTAEGSGLDYESPDTWKQIHPGNVPTTWMRGEYERNPDQFARTILNVTNRESGVAHCISIPAWERCALLSQPPERDDRISLAVDCEPDSKSSSIVACLGDASVVELIDHRPGVDWVTGRLVELVERYNLQPVAFDNRSPTGVLEARLHAAGVPLRVVGLGESANAAQGFADLVHGEQVKHVRHPILDAAVEGASRRALGDGGWSFSRSRSSAPVSPLVAASMAWYCHANAHGDISLAVY